MHERLRRRIDASTERLTAVMRNLSAATLIERGVAAEVLSSLDDAERDRALRLLRQALDDQGRLDSRLLTESELGELQALLNDSKTRYEAYRNSPYLDQARDRGVTRYGGD